MNWFKQLFSRRRRYNDLSEEIQQHLEEKIEELVATGMPRKEAAAAARREFGNVTLVEEDSRAIWRWPSIENILMDGRYGLRQLRRNPGFSAVAILTLALGIGANTALFSVVNSVLLNPLPYPHPGQLVAVYQRTPQFQKAGDTYPNFLDWKKDNRSFAAIGAYREQDFNLTSASEPERLRGQMISADFLSLLAIRPLLGRTFRPEEDQVGASPVALLGDGFWTRKFGSSPQVLNQSLTINGTAYLIVGVVPGRSPLYRTSDVFVPIGQWDDPTFRDRRVSMGMHVVGRLKQRLDVRQAQADVDGIARNLETAYPEADKGVGISLVPLKDTIVENIRPILLLLLGAVGFVLLIACANVAGLLLARTTSRTREFAVRAALGASPARMIRQLLTESSLLAIIGGAFGLLLAAWGAQAALGVLPDALPRADEIRLDGHVLVFTFVASGLVGIAFGLAPALNTARADLHDTFKKGGRGSSGARYRAQGILVVTEMAMAVVLLVGAGLMLRSLTALWSVDPGFNPHNSLAFNVAVSPHKLSNPAQIREVFRELPARFEAIQGVAAASALTGALPMHGSSEMPLWREGQPPPTNSGNMHFALFYAVTPGYWRAMAIPLIRGRYLTDQDNEASHPVIVIDQSLAREFFPGEDPLGRRINVGLIGTEPEVVGIVGHVKHWGLASDNQESIQAQFYLPFMQIPDKFMPLVASGVDFVVRTSGAPQSFVGAIRKASQQFDGSQVVYGFEAMDEIVSDSVSTQRSSMILLALFAAVALVLSSVGIYGVISYLVEQRTHEIGVRLTLGALRKDVLWLILGHGTKMAMIGIAIGLGASFGLTRLMTKLLFGVTPTDPVTFGGVTILLLLVALLACFVPARRAMQVDPMVALRHE
jgi:predicted permease